LIGAGAALLATVARAEQGHDAIRRLDELWEQRATDPTVREAIEYGTALLTAEPANFDAAWRMARVMRWLALTHTGDEDKRRLSTKAMHWAQRAIDLRPERVEGHFYYMMAIGEYGGTLSIPRALYEGIGGKFERAGLEAYRIDRDYEDGEVMTALGRYYFVLPWPKRDLVKSRRLLEEGASTHPEVLMNFVYLAELEHEAGNPDKARAALERVLQPGPKVSRSEQQGEARALARAHLAKWFPEGASD
jgi:tetratricopeptide (TPR) repeat protein